MPVVKIVATFDDDDRQRVVIMGVKAVNEKLDIDSEHFGYVNDWSDDEQSYRRYPFILERLDESEAVLDWGAFDGTTTLLNVFNRRIVSGEKLIRTEANEKWSYTVQEVCVIA